MLTSWRIHSVFLINTNVAEVITGNRFKYSAMNRLDYHVELIQCTEVQSKTRAQRRWTRVKITSQPGPHLYLTSVDTLAKESLQMTTRPLPQKEVGGAPTLAIIKS